MIDTTSLSAAAIGGAMGLSFVLWNKKNELQERCEFMHETQRELDFAFEKADELLSSGRLPATIRSMFLHLFAAYSNPSLGEAFAREMAEPERRQPRELKENPLREAMRELAEMDEEMERYAHRAMVAMAFNLMFVHLANNIKVQRVRNEAVSDPDSVWPKLWKSLGGNDHQDTGGGMVHA